MLTKDNKAEEQTMPTSHQRLSFGFYQEKAQPIVGYKRSVQVQDIVDKCFLTVAKKKEGYIFCGSEDYNYNLSERISLQVGSILRYKINSANEQDDTLCVLDIGAGKNFQLVKTMQLLHGSKVKMYGIVACEEGSVKKDEFHVVGNAENLSLVFTKQSFHFIFSRATYMHFADPVGALIEAYRKLNPGGTIFIDSLPIPGCNKYCLSQIIDWLQNQGYPTLGDCHYDQMIQSFILQKPLIGKDELIFPVTISSVNFTEQTCCYQPHPDVFNVSLQFKLIKKTEAEMAYINEIKNLQDRVKKFAFCKCDNLQTLFIQPEYQKLPLAEKADCVLAIIAKTVSLDDYENILKTMSECEICPAVNHLSLFLKGERPFYQLHTDDLISIPAEWKLLCINGVAICEILIRSKANQVCNQLKAMNISYEHTSNHQTFDRILEIFYHHQINNIYFNIWQNPKNADKQTTTARSTSLQKIEYSCKKKCEEIDVSITKTSGNISVSIRKDTESDLYSLEVMQNKSHISGMYLNLSQASKYKNELEKNDNFQSFIDFLVHQGQSAVEIANFLRSNRERNILGPV